jgi:hypothetical protein
MEYFRALLERVKALTDWDDDMAVYWFNTENPLLGDVSPVDMFMSGNAGRLEKFIAEEERAKAAIEGRTADGAESVH